MVRYTTLQIWAAKSSSSRALQKFWKTMFLDKIIRWVLFFGILVSSAGIVLASAFAGGLSGDVVRNAMCEDYYRSCMDEILLDNPECDSVATDPKCESVRRARRNICTKRYEKCLNPQPRKGTLPVRPGKKEN